VMVGNILWRTIPILVWTTLLLAGYARGDIIIAARTTKRILRTFLSTEVAI